MEDTAGLDQVVVDQTVNQETVYTEKNLRKHVEVLAVEIGERNLLNKPDALKKAQQYIEGTWLMQGYEVKKQEFLAHSQPVANLEVIKVGTEHPEQIILIGAHYDTVKGSPGANDNASSVAALLELSKALAGKNLKKTVKFVAFTNEEPPFFKSTEMGSYVYAKKAREQGEQIQLMVALDSIGHYSSERKTQKRPVFLSPFYPDTGNFLALVSDLGNGAQVDKAAKIMKQFTDLPISRIKLPGFTRGIDFSDHAAFWKFGYPALMVTDTAFLRDPHYHQESDTPNHLNYTGLSKATDGLIGLVESLANE